MFDNYFVFVWSFDFFVRDKEELYETKKMKDTKESGKDGRRDVRKTFINKDTA